MTPLEIADTFYLTMKRTASIGGESGVKAGDIPKRKLGKTGEMLTVIGPGGARFRMISWEEATAVVRRCYDLGINYALSLPTHCISLGLTSIGQVEDDVRSAESFQPLSAQDSSPQVLIMSGGVPAISWLCAQPGASPGGMGIVSTSTHGCPSSHCWISKPKA